MVLRRIVYQIGVLAGLATFLLTLWVATTRWELDLLAATVRAIGAGAVVVAFAVCLSGVIVKLGGPDR